MAELSPLRRRMIEDMTVRNLSYIIVKNRARGIANVSKSP